MSCSLSCRCGGGPAKPGGMTFSARKNAAGRVVPSGLDDDLGCARCVALALSGSVKDSGHAGQPRPGGWWAQAPAGWNGRRRARLIALARLQGARACGASCDTALRVLPEGEPRGRRHRPPHPRRSRGGSRAASSPGPPDGPAGAPAPRRSGRAVAPRPSRDGRRTPSAWPTAAGRRSRPRARELKRSNSAAGQDVGGHALVDRGQRRSSAPRPSRTRGPRSRSSAGIRAQRDARSGRAATTRSRCRAATPRRPRRCRCRTGSTAGRAAAWSRRRAPARAVPTLAVLQDRSGPRRTRP